MAVAELGDLLQGVPHRREPGIALLVDAVTETHDLALLGERFPRLGFGVAHGTDLLEHCHHSLVRAAVQRACSEA
ncbi:hypothetical protein [Amycolatopsis mediterranei]|nr:hypothetical protein [Amycolatopsis mediterranei]UZF76418.1 hypothetical protein ISP_007554 [Amycolatopsis mediterranei]